MQNAIRQKIKKLCAKMIERARKRALKEREYADKFVKRTGHPTTIIAPTDNYASRHFDPRYCKRNANFLAKTIWHKIQQGTYAPEPALKFDLPKPGGGKRSIMQFTIPDSAVASILNKRLTARNLIKQSGNSFAYRPDRSVFDALLKLKSAIRPQRNFILQLDFEKYFDTIPQRYMVELLSNRDYILISRTEKSVVSEFLNHSFTDRENYDSGPFEKRTIGTPQGSSISLTLANLANHPLDVQLEAINGQFTRYADDTVVVTYSYEDAIKAYDIFHAHCRESGLIINKIKSPGICILSNAEEEFRSIADFKFLGYGICVDGLVMHATVEQRLRAKLSRLINLYLLHYIEKTPPVRISDRIGDGYDWDLLGLISEIRKVLYGGLSELQIFLFVKKGIKLRQMKGMMGFYALLDDGDALTRLDGWLVSSIKQALIKRYKILGVSKTIKSRDLIAGAWYDASKYTTASFDPDVKLPSFVRGWSAARKYYFSYGLDDVEPPKYIAYY
jgi:retron-type reverse transcriptase